MANHELSLFYLQKRTEVRFINGLPYREMHFRQLSWKSYFLPMERCLFREFSIGVIVLKSIQTYSIWGKLPVVPTNNKCFAFKRHFKEDDSEYLPVEPDSSNMSLVWHPYWQACTKWPIKLPLKMVKCTICQEGDEDAASLAAFNALFSVSKEGRWLSKDVAPLSPSLRELCVCRLSCVTPTRGSRSKRYFTGSQRNLKHSVWPLEKSSDKLSVTGIHSVRF